MKQAEIMCSHLMKTKHKKMNCTFGVVIGAWMAKSSNKIWSVTSILETQSLCSKYRFAMPDVLLVLPPGASIPEREELCAWTTEREKCQPKEWLK